MWNRRCRVPMDAGGWRARRGRAGDTRSQARAWQIGGLLCLAALAYAFYSFPENSFSLRLRQGQAAQPQEELPPPPPIPAAEVPKGCLYLTSVCVDQQQARAKLHLRELACRLCKGRHPPLLLLC